MEGRPVCFCGLYAFGYPMARINLLRVPETSDSLSSYHKNALMFCNEEREQADTITWLLRLQRDGSAHQGA